MSGWLLRVGIDKKAGETLAPIFDDNSFEYIPIPESATSFEERTYQNTPTTNSHLKGKMLADLLWSNKYKSSKLHLDPEFITFTYGDPTRKASSLRNLKKDDYLVFYAGFKPQNGNEDNCYIFSYFVLDEDAIDFDSLNINQFKKNWEIFKNNAHIKRYTPFSKVKTLERQHLSIVDENASKNALNQLRDNLKASGNVDLLSYDYKFDKTDLGFLQRKLKFEFKDLRKKKPRKEEISIHLLLDIENFLVYDVSNLVVIKGKALESKLLNKAIRISENIKDSSPKYPYQLTSEMEKRLEIKRSQPAHPMNLTRASVHKIGNIHNLKDLLKEGL